MMPAMSDKDHAHEQARLDLYSAILQHAPVVISAISSRESAKCGLCGSEISGPGSASWMRFEHDEACAKRTEAALVASRKFAIESEDAALERRIRAAHAGLDPVAPVPDEDPAGPGEAQARS